MPGSWFSTGDAQLSAAEVLGVDLLGLGDPPDLVDRAPHLQQKPPRGLPAEAPPSSPGLTGKAELHQAPLRPEAPKPAISASSTTTRNEGSYFSR